MKLSITAVFLFICQIVIGQTSEVKPLNPNGDSELALLMRAMYDEAIENKKLIKEGKSPHINLDHQAIFTAEPTNPKQVNNDSYPAFAKMYLNFINELEAGSKDIETMYQSMVESCRQCHLSLCPGPIVRINKLDLD